MAIGGPSELVLDYDEDGDVLYASLGAPQHAITDEVEDDILLRYCPPKAEVVGITIVNFRRHFPDREPAKVVEDLLRKYPLMPWPLDTQR
jgi:uncharacterized protein YuzE